MIKLENIKKVFRTEEVETWALREVNLEVEEGEFVAIMGPSGCGKSTLLKLLVRLYKPSYGTVNMGGMNVTALNLRKWREMCGVVMQDGKIFSDTIKNNIVLDDEHVDEEQLVRCCQMAQIKDEIDQMPRGFDTEIGEQGRGLSGGQKQRLLIARALYRNPQYLFLDEATNSLDTVNEQKIVTSLNTAFENRTVVIIAHRLSTIRNANQIVVIDKGEIKEFGTHKVLMDRKGIYYNLVKSQYNDITLN